MNTKKIGIVLLASLIGILLSSGVASAAVGNCCLPIDGTHDHCFCSIETDAQACADKNGMWIGSDPGCTIDEITGCTQYCTEGGKCVPEITTIALLGTGLLGMVGYFRLRRKEE